ncbi:UDP-N-acetylmuramate dehydrogenase [Cytobacillus purgationiresistens]|uniref:UDP-N-acetylenolpyruvoylglucosamine reductase n=1 Tax=Cytobacillus purgationiresistens TaxID=863449 RepID=A0ABU0AB83_9BACI|nr:UDP-N-acetylmuramate dehydrogenase [Cytobacillus purgationiresistens]MDQ0268512.1 UDP-N-acetylmuramate dehydrogenase [Cytobacillus purgationiresistens]
MNIIEALQQLCPNSLILPGESMAKYTYIKVGGKADFYVAPINIEDTQSIVKFALTNELPLTILGKGSNVIISDNGLKGIVLNLDHFNHINIQGRDIVAGSGAKIIDVSKAALSNELTGLEFACGIPGSVGGAVFMNAGAYGGEISNVLIEVKALTLKGELRTFYQDDFQFGYRSSIFSKEGLIILEAKFRLQHGKDEHIRSDMNEFTLLREEKQPLEYPSCGSVFKRPPNHFAGKLIADCGLQGLRVGGAEVSKKHAGFIVNIDHASANDYIHLIEQVRTTVKEKFDIALETEVKILGEK